VVGAESPRKMLCRPDVETAEHEARSMKVTSKTFFAAAEFYSKVDATLKWMMAVALVPGVLAQWNVPELVLRQMLQSKLLVFGVIGSAWSCAVWSLVKPGEYAERCHRQGRAYNILRRKADDYVAYLKAQPKPDDPARARWAEIMRERDATELENPSVSTRFHDAAKRNVDSGAKEQAKKERKGDVQQ
jgi:hypothetical protein